MSVCKTIIVIDKLLLEEEAKMKTILTGIIVAFISISVLSGCNTTRGVGQDISATGHAISRAAS